ncbi:hypothetical protein VA7868_04604 [Vibrio aerogenes CECT 7868]|uniref:Uncharacterized protein n=1 Tax=Vibrio aerogenes CECT 7868 TaxID=1216006 RepID=A0A1M6FA23_9VIBR|nr:hypothetical protein [Vibrio aerogenes]SHI94515.1 hypothetical protein VA7868_04604 [Vibrio aerogenes CECT 7868]
MTDTTDILGYVLCRTCHQPKAIKQGKGKRAAFVHGRCECGPDTRTGKAAQAEMKAYQSLEAVQAQIEAMKQPEPEQTESLPIQTEKQTQSPTEPETKQEPQSQPVTTVKCVGIGAFLGLVCGGIIKTIKAVA